MCTCSTAKKRCTDSRLYRYTAGLEAACTERETIVQSPLTSQFPHPTPSIVSDNGAPHSMIGWHGLNQVRILIILRLMYWTARNRSCQCKALLSSSWLPTSIFPPSAAWQVDHFGESRSRSFLEIFREKAPETVGYPRDLETSVRQHDYSANRARELPRSISTIDVPRNLSPGLDQ